MQKNIKNFFVLVICLIIVKLLIASNSSAAVIGDINGDGTVDILDVILTLQVASGIVPSGNIQLSSDVNDDQKIGVEEAIYAMRAAGGLINEPTTVTSLTGRVWMDRNLGASQVATSSNDTAAYGDLFVSVGQVS